MHASNESLLLMNFLPCATLSHFSHFALVQSYRNHPSVTGWRMKRSLVDSWTVRCFEKYFSFQLYKHGKTEFNSSARYVFGFAPHGIVPVTAAYLTRTAQVTLSPIFPIFPISLPLSLWILAHVPLTLCHIFQWQALVGDFLPAILTSSIIHYVPLIRDCLQYLGAVEVTHLHFSSSLSDVLACRFLAKDFDKDLRDKSLCFSCLVDK